MLNLTDVILKGGKVLQVQTELTTEEFHFSHGSYPVIDKKPVNLRIENKGKKVLQITGDTEVTVEIPCARCLDEVPTVIPMEFDIEVDLKETEQDQPDILKENDFIDGYNLDVDKLVYGEALLNWPARVLCKEDCLGLCKVCGQNLNRGTCSCDNTELDPRMAKIQDIFRKFKEV